MPIKFNCHKCGANLRVPEKHIGKKARCPKCDAKCVVPAMSQRDPGSNLGGSFEDMGDLLDKPLSTPVSLPASPPPVAPMAAPAPAAPIPVAPIVSPPPAATPPTMVAPPAMAAPPVAPMAPPMAPLGTSVPATGYASPYAAPMSQPKAGGGGAISGSVVQPLYEARTLIKIFGWGMFIIGIMQFFMFGLQMIMLVIGVASNSGRNNMAAASFGVLVGAIFGLIIPFVTTWIGWQIKSAGSNLTIGVQSGDKQRIRLACQQLASYFRLMGVLTLVGMIIMAIALLFLLIGVAFAIAAGV